MPGSIVIIGSGAIGLEYGHIYSIYGVDVTIVEMMPNLVPALHDTEITDAIKASLESGGIKVKCGSGIESVEVQEDGARQEHTGKRRGALLGRGAGCHRRTLNTRGMGLEEVGVKMEKNGQIVTDEHMRTSVPNIFAAGRHHRRHPALGQGPAPGPRHSRDDSRRRLLHQLRRHPGDYVHGA